MSTETTSTNATTTTTNAPSLLHRNLTEARGHVRAAAVALGRLAQFQRGDDEDAERAVNVLEVLGSLSDADLDISEAIETFTSEVAS